MITSTIFFLIFAVTISEAIVWDPKCLDGPAVKFDAFKNSCNIPSTIDYSQGFVKNCFSTAFANLTADEIKESFKGDIFFGKPFRCATECYIQKIGLIIIDEIQMDVLEKIITTDQEWAQLRRAATEKCKHLLTKFNFEDKHDGCSYVPSFYSACVNTQLFKTCPAHIWNHNNEICNQLKEYSENCSILQFLLRADNYLP